MSADVFTTNAAEREKLDDFVRVILCASVKWQSIYSVHSLKEPHIMQCSRTETHLGETSEPLLSFSDSKERCTVSGSLYRTTCSPPSLIFSLALPSSFLSTIFTPFFSLLGVLCPYFQQQQSSRLVTSAASFSSFFFVCVFCVPLVHF